MKANYYAGLDFGQVYQDASYGDESLVGAAVGIDGNIKSLEYNFSVSTPLKYPATLDIDRVNVNFNFFVPNVKDNETNENRDRYC